ncbi:hypothetical protein IAT38_004187 [Cryptococcus sp. DSM 104549]
MLRVIISLSTGFMAFYFFGPPQDFHLPIIALPPVPRLTLPFFHQPHQANGPAIATISPPFDVPSVPTPPSDTAAIAAVLGTDSSYLSREDVPPHGASSQPDGRTESAGASPEATWAATNTAGQATREETAARPATAALLGARGAWTAIDGASTQSCSALGSGLPSGWVGSVVKNIFLTMDLADVILPEAVFNPHASGPDLLSCTLRLAARDKTGVSFSRGSELEPPSARKASGSSRSCFWSLIWFPVKWFTDTNGKNGKEHLCASDSDNGTRAGAGNRRRRNTRPRAPSRIILNGERLTRVCTDSGWQFAVVDPRPSAQHADGLASLSAMVLPAEEAMSANVSVEAEVTNLLDDWPERPPRPPMDVDEAANLDPHRPTLAPSARYARPTSPQDPPALPTRVVAEPVASSTQGQIMQQLVNRSRVSGPSVAKSPGKSGVAPTVATPRPVISSTGALPSSTRSSSSPSTPPSPVISTPSDPVEFQLRGREASCHSRTPDTAALRSASSAEVTASNAKGTRRWIPSQDLRDWYHERQAAKKAAEGLRANLEEMANSHSPEAGYPEATLQTIRPALFERMRQARLKAASVAGQGLLPILPRPTGFLGRVGPRRKKVEEAAPVQAPLPVDSSLSGDDESRGEMEMTPAPNLRGWAQATRLAGSKGAAVGSPETRHRRFQINRPLYHSTTQTTAIRGYTGRPVPAPYVERASVRSTRSNPEVESTGMTHARRGFQPREVTLSDSERTFSAPISTMPVVRATALAKEDLEDATTDTDYKPSATMLEFISRIHAKQRERAWGPPKLAAGGVGEPNSLAEESVKTKVRDSFVDQSAEVSVVGGGGWPPRGGGRGEVKGRVTRKGVLARAQKKVLPWAQALPHGQYPICAPNSPTPDNSAESLDQGISNVPVTPTSTRASLQVWSPFTQRPLDFPEDEVQASTPARSTQDPGVYGELGWPVLGHPFAGMSTSTPVGPKKPVQGMGWVWWRGVEEEEGLEVVTEEDVREHGGEGSRKDVGGAGEGRDGRGAGVAGDEGDAGEDVSWLKRWRASRSRKAAEENRHARRRAEVEEQSRERRRVEEREAYKATHVASPVINEPAPVINEPAPVSRLTAGLRAAAGRPVFKRAASSSHATANSVASDHSAERSPLEAVEPVLGLGGSVGCGARAEEVMRRREAEAELEREREERAEEEVQRRMEELRATLEAALWSDDLSTITRSATPASLARASAHGASKAGESDYFSDHSFRLGPAQPYPRCAPTSREDSRRDALGWPSGDEGFSIADSSVLTLNLPGPSSVNDSAGSYPPPAPGPVPAEAYALLEELMDAGITTVTIAVSDRPALNLSALGYLAIAGIRGGASQDWWERWMRLLPLAREKEALAALEREREARMAMDDEGRQAIRAAASHSSSRSSGHPSSSGYASRAPTPSIPTPSRTPPPRAGPTAPPAPAPPTRVRPCLPTLARTVKVPCTTYRAVLQAKADARIWHRRPPHIPSPTPARGLTRLDHAMHAGRSPGKPITSPGYYGMGYGTGYVMGYGMGYTSGFEAIEEEVLPFAHAPQVQAPPPPKLQLEAQPRLHAVAWPPTPDENRSLLPTDSRPWHVRGHGAPWYQSTPVAHAPQAVAGEHEVHPRLRPAPSALHHPRDLLPVTNSSSSSVLFPTSGVESSSASVPSAEATPRASRAPRRAPTPRYAPESLQALSGQRPESSLRTPQTSESVAKRRVESVVFTVGSNGEVRVPGTPEKRNNGGRRTRIREGWV